MRACPSRAGHLLAESDAGVCRSLAAVVFVAQGCLWCVVGHLNAMHLSFVLKMLLVARWLRY